MTAFPRTIIPFEVSSLEMPGPLISKAQSGRVNIRSTQQIGRTWTEHYLINVRSVAGRGLLAAVDDFYRNGTIFTIDHRDHLTPMGAGGGSPLVNQSPQLVANPENFAGWTPDGTSPVLTAGQSDPYGTTAAYLLSDDDGASLERLLTVVTFTGDAEKCCSVGMRQGSSASSFFGIFDVTTATWRHKVSVTWTAGVPTLATVLGSGTRYTPEIWLSGGWYRLSASAVGVIAANTNRMYVSPTLGSAAAETGTTYIFGANAWNTTTPAGYIGPSHLTATGSTVAVDGGTASLANWLRAGDVLALGGVNPIYEVTADVATQAGGYASVPINPPIFQGGAPADNAVVTITGVTMNACILEPPSYPSTSGIGADYGELVCHFSESS